MKLPISGYINDARNILLAEDVVEDYFDLYSVTYNGETFVVEGIKTETGEISALIQLDEFGNIPIIIKKDICNNNVGLFLSETLKPEAYNNLPIIPKDVLRSVFDTNDIVLVDVEEPPLTEATIAFEDLEEKKKQKELFYEHVHNLVEEYTGETIQALTESMQKFVKTKIAEHSASLLSEYLTNIEKAKPQLEQYIYDNIVLNNKKIEESFNVKSDLLDKKINKKLLDLKNLKTDIQATVSEHIDTADSYIKKVISETTDKALSEIRDSINENNTQLQTLIDNAKKDLLEENSINITKSILEIKQLNEDHLLKTNESIKESIKSLATENEKIYESVKREKEDIIKENLEQSKKIDNIKNNLITVHSEQLASMKSIFIDAETSLKSSFNQYTKNLTEEVKKDVDLKFRTELNEAKKISKETENLKKDIRLIKTQLDSQFTQMRRYVESFGGGGGTVAVQYAAGGTMNGNLDINGSLEASAVSIQNVTFTSELSTNVASITAMPEFLKIEVNGVDRYVRLFTVA